MSGYEFGSHLSSYEGPVPAVFVTLGYRTNRPEPGVAELTWADPKDYTFPGPKGDLLVHGGLIATLADAAMGHAAMTLLDADQTFLTGDLRVDYMRAVPSQPLLGIGRVERRSRRIYHCSAEVMSADRSTVFAAARCIQVIL